MRLNPKHHWENQRKETLKKAVVKEKHSGSSFLVVHACNSHHEWLILFFGFKSNLFKLLCIEVIFIYNIQLLIVIDIIILFSKLETIHDLDP